MKSLPIETLYLLLEIVNENHSHRKQFIEMLIIKIKEINISIAKTIVLLEAILNVIKRDTKNINK